MTEPSEPMAVPHGAWRSPLDAHRAASGAARFPGLAITAGPAAEPTLWWAETRPDDGGRIAVSRSDGSTAPLEVGPSDLRVRSRVNEYGGGVFWVDEHQLFVVEESSQRVLSIGLDDGARRWVTKAPSARRAWQHAAGVLAAGSAWMVCERERHVDDHGSGLDEAVNELVALRRDPPDRHGGDGHVLVGPHDAGGGDFVAAPALSPDGSVLAWLRWDHPDMPWDAAELWAGLLRLDDGVPRLGEVRRVAGGRAAGTRHGLQRAVSVCLPEWDPSGRLWWCDDRSDWWHLHAAPAPGLPEEGSGDDVDPLVVGEQEEVGEPRWVAGGHRYGFTGDGRVVAVASRDGLDRVVLLDASTGERHEMPGPVFSSVEVLRVHGATVALVGGWSEHPTSVWKVDLDTGEAADLRGAAPSIDPAWISSPEPVTFPTGHAGSGQVAHALFYPPRSGDHVGPSGERPPLVVRIHGGPTAAARPELSASVQFWTTRGFAVVDVNYRGSVGFGRPYRDALLTNWGVADVEDCLAVTRHLAETGRIDGDRCVIRGGSAGGFTALSAICFQRQWGFGDAVAAACCLYGVTDLAAMAADTHKFESRYIDGLVAPLPEGAHVYRERSPLHHADRIDRPLLLLQGSEDRVVPPSQSEVLVEALRRNRVPHRYVLFAGEGHGFHRSETVVRALEAELGFYGAVLGFTPDGLDAPFEFD